MSLSWFNIFPGKHAQSLGLPFLWLSDGKFVRFGGSRLFHTLPGVDVSTILSSRVMHSMAVGLLSAEFFLPSRFSGAFALQVTNQHTKQPLTLILWKPIPTPPGQIRCMGHDESWHSVVLHLLAVSECHTLRLCFPRCAKGRSRLWILDKCNSPGWMESCMRKTLHSTIRGELARRAKLTDSHFVIYLFFFHVH